MEYPIQKVQEVETSGKLEEIIEKHLISCLDDIVGDSFRWNGEAKKSIEEALKGKLNISTENLNISRYQKIVTDIVEKQVNDTVVKNLSDQIKETVDGITEVLDKKDWKLSDIISKFVDSLDKSYDGDMDDQYGECTLIVKEGRGFAHIYFDKEEGKANYSCSNQIDLHDGKIYNVKIDGENYSPFHISSMDSFESFMFKLYCNNVRVEVDESNCELDYCREDVD